MQQMNSKINKSKGVSAFMQVLSEIWSNFVYWLISRKSSSVIFASCETVHLDVEVFFLCVCATAW